MSGHAVADEEQTLDHPTADEVVEVGASDQDKRAFARSAGPEFSEFDYRPIPVVAVAGLMIAILSVSGLFIWLAIPLSVFGFVISLAALLLIRASHGAYGGTWVAMSGLILSTAFFCGGIGVQVYAYQTEVPEGFERVNFVQDISKKGLMEVDGMLQPHPDVVALDGKKVFLKGYMYQTNSTQDLRSFLMVKDNQDCCFGANPSITDRLGVVMTGDKTVDYRGGKVAIAGTFRLNPNYDPEESLAPIYLIEGEKFITRVSDF